MRDLIAVFKSRKDAMQFAMMMNKSRVRVRMISTPSSIGSSCDLSVRFPRVAFSIAERVLSYAEFQTFKGFFEL